MKKARNLLLFAASILIAITISTPASAAGGGNKYRALAGERRVEKKEGAPKEMVIKSPDEIKLEEEVREFEKKAIDWRKYQSEFGIFGGDFLGDEWYNNWDVGARYYFNFSKTLGIGVEYQYNPIRADSSGDFGRSLTTDDSHTLFGGITVANTAAFTAGKSIIPCDFYLTLGGGSMQINKDWEWLAVVGGGLKVYMPVRWMAVRFDVNTYMHPTPKPGGDAFNADLAINAGVSFLIQPNMRKIKEEAMEEEKASAAPAVVQ